jgi:DNA-directed RNA polymerase specialized sigma24 family protein
MIDKWRSNSNNIFCTSISIPESTFSEASSTSYCMNNSSVCVGNIEFENNNTLSYLSSQISPSDYTLLSMKYIQGYNYNEIGNEFNITSSTVSNRINYIKTKLKKNNIKLLSE